MTLVINFLCPNYVVQVSDRRLTSTTRWKVTRIENDNANKAVLWGGRASFAYTGLAKIGGRRTDEWLARTLGQAAARNLADACRALAGRATEAFRHIHLPRQQRHLKAHWFTGIGWTNAYSADLDPIEMIVSNMHFPDGKRAPGPQREFVVLHHTARPGTAFRISSFGQEINDRKAQAMRRSIIQIVNRGGTIETISRYLCWALRNEAASNRTIGDDVMLCYLPRAAALEGIRTRSASVTNGAFGESNTFVHYRSGFQYPEQLGPHFVSNGAVFLHTKMGSL